MDRVELVDIIIRWRHTHYSHCREEFCSHYFRTNFTVRNNSIFRHVFEPSSRNFNRSSSFCESTVGFYFLNYWVLVEVVFNKGIGILVDGLLIIGDSMV